MIEKSIKISWNVWDWAGKDYNKIWVQNNQLFFILYTNVPSGWGGGVDRVMCILSNSQ